MIDDRHIAASLQLSAVSRIHVAIFRQESINVVSDPTDDELHRVVASGPEGHPARRDPEGNTELDRIITDYRGSAELRNH